MACNLFDGMSVTANAEKVQFQPTPLLLGQYYALLSGAENAC